MSFPIEVVLFAFLLVVGFAIARLRDLFAAAMLTGIFSLLSAGLFVLMDAVDVAFTEAAVGAGISTVFMLGALGQTNEIEHQTYRRVLPLVIVLVTGAALAYATLDMPHYGDPAAAIHHHVAPHYLERTATEIGVPNVVTAILASYRGYDTLGELVVIFSAGVAVALLLRRTRPPASREASVADSQEALERVIRRVRLQVPLRRNVILRVVIERFVPFILLFGLYVQFHGDFGPGGGFQAGVIFAAGLILHSLIFGLIPTDRVLPMRVAETGMAGGVLLYAGVGIAALVAGGVYLDYGALDPHDPAHGQHLGITLVELGVGITVASVMVSIFRDVARRRIR